MIYIFLFYFQVYLVSPKHKMVIRTDEILCILSKLSDESGLKVTVQESVKGGVVAGTACTIGGVLLGPPGLAIGGMHSAHCYFWLISVGFRVNY